MDIIKPELPVYGIMSSRIGGRSENQDTCGYSETPYGLLLVVCDGMGGGPGGKTASLTAVEAIINYVKNSTSTTSPLEDSKPESNENAQEPESNSKEAETENELPSNRKNATAMTTVTPVASAEILREAVQAANTALRDKINEQPELNGMGTTVTAMLINEEGVAVAHVGDSRIYQLRHKKIIFRTADHSEVGKMVRNGIITEEQARLSAMSNIITRALGIGDTVDVDTTTLSYEKGDRFVLCTDGIWGAMPQPELVKMFCKKGNLMEVAEALNAKVEDAGQAKGGKHDNFSMIMLLVEKNTNKPVITTHISAQEKNQTEKAELDTKITPSQKVVPGNGFNKTAKIVAYCVVVICVLAVLFFAIISHNNTYEKNDIDTTDNRVGNPEKTLGERKTEVGIVNEENETSSDQEATDEEPTSNTQPASHLNEENLNSMPAISQKDNRKDNKPETVPSEQVLCVDTIALKQRIDCYNSTINVLNFISGNVLGIVENTNVSQTGARNQVSKKSVDSGKGIPADKIKNAKNKIEEKLNQYSSLYDEGQKQKLKAIYDGLGEKVLISRIDEAGFKNAKDTLARIINELRGSIKERLDNAKKELISIQLKNAFKNKA